MKILIVDDNQDSRLILRSNLEGDGHVVEEAANGVEALEIAGRSLPDMIISDILMPEMDGFILCRRVKEDRRLNKIPFIFYTATYVDPEDERLALSLGAARFILKPVEFDKFLTMIKAVFTEYREKKLPLHERPLKDDDMLSMMYEKSIARKLDKKVRELNLYRQIFTTATDAIAIISPDGRYIGQNASHRALLGYPDAELSGITPAIQFGEKEFAGIMERLSGKGVYSGELMGRTKDGESRCIELSAFAVADEKGKVKNYIFIGHDITDRKRLEAQLLQSQKMEAVGQLAGGVAHDFNNILTAIISYAYMLKNSVKEDERAVNNVDKILELSDRAANITRGLLTFSRKQYIDLAPVDLNDIIRKVEKRLKQFITEGTRLEIRLADGDLMIIADKTQIEQVIINLTTNARDAMPEGGELVLETGLAEMDANFIKSHGFGKAGRFAVLSVTDTGTGMNEEVRKKIFEPFFTTREVGKGPGLGLAIAYGIIKQHSGYINVYSEPGKGTTFRIYLPEIKAQPAGEKEETFSYPAGKGETILIAEDEPAVRDSMKTILKECGYNVIEAVNGVDAVEKFRQDRHEIRLLILDLVMPGMNGKEAYEEIRRLNPDMKAIFTSGYTADIIAKKKALDKDAVFISKPILPDKLLSKIREVLSE